MVIEENKKHQHKIKFFSSRKHSRVLLCYAAPTFMLFQYSLFLKCVNNLEIYVRTVSLHFKLSLQFKLVLLMRADDYLVNTRF